MLHIFVFIIYTRYHLDVFYCIFNYFSDFLFNMFLAKNPLRSKELLSLDMEYQPDLQGWEWFGELLIRSIPC